LGGFWDCHCRTGHVESAPGVVPMKGSGSAAP
jgi:hypothetical protein